jgi:hypothetical protein
MDELIRQLSERHKVDADLISQLLQYEQTKIHMERRRGAKDELRRIIEKHLEEHQK